MNSYQTVPKYYFESNTTRLDGQNEMNSSRLAIKSYLELNTTRLAENVDRISHHRNFTVES